MPEILNLTITDVAFGGDGVGRLPDKRVVFVPFTAPGDEVTIELVSLHPKHARGRVTCLRDPGPGRTVAPCPLFGRCGGCQYQHLEYGVQVQLKAQQLMATLQRLGGLRSLPDCEKILPAPAPYGYRNKLRLEPVTAPERTPDPNATTDRDSGFHQGQTSVYGYYALDNTTVLPVPACPIAAASLNALLPTANAAAMANPISAGNAKPALTLRAPAKGNPVFFFGRAGETMPCLVETLLGREVRVPTGGFWQVNPTVAEALVTTVCEWLTPQPLELLVDAYAGVGAFSLALGERVRRTVLVELDKAATVAAALNREAWGLPCAELRTQTAESALPALLQRLSDAERRGTTVVLDPPRTGCQPEVLHALAGWPVAAVLYVSCNAATLARDLRLLSHQGPYRLQRLALFDMFPQTAHFETACLLVT